MTVVEVKPLRRDVGHRKGGLRLHPEDGEPRCLIEQLAQAYHMNKIGLYTALVATLILCGIVILLLQSVFGLDVSLS